MIKYEKNSIKSNQTRPDFLPLVSTVQAPLATSIRARETLSNSLAVALPLGVPRDVRYASQQVCAVDLWSVDCGVLCMYESGEPFATDGELCDPYCSVLSR